MADFSNFIALDIRVGKIIKVEEFIEGKIPAFKLTIDFGKEIGTKKTAAQVKANYSEETLIGKQILAVVNFPPKQIGKFVSECLVLGVPDEKGNVAMLKVDREVPLGGRVF